MRKALTDATEVKILDYALKPFHGSEAIRVSDGFEQVATEKYELICVDAPYGGDMKSYSRVDIISLVPDHLAKSFVILYDNVHREPEQHTCQLLKEAMKQYGIDFRKEPFPAALFILLAKFEDVLYP